MEVNAGMKTIMDIQKECHKYRIVEVVENENFYIDSIFTFATGTRRGS